MMLFRSFACLFAALLAIPALAQPCTPQFMQGYDIGTITATGYDANEGPIQCAAVFDDGAGPALYIAGNTVTISGTGATILSKFANGRWNAITGFNGQIHAMTVVNTGAGQVLYVGGSFTVIPGNLPASGVASFNGTTWSRVGPASSAFNVRALIAVPQGSGHTLYAGGGNGTQCFLRRWEGADWTAIALPPLSQASSGTSGIRALAYFDDGSGPKLYVGASVFWSMSQTNFGVISYDGANWTPVPGIYQISGWPEVTSLAVLNEPSGPSLYVSGYFSSGPPVGPQPAPRPLARLVNGSWQVLPAPPLPEQEWHGASTLLPFNGPNGPALAVAVGLDAHLATRIRVFQNDTWTDLLGLFGADGGNLNVRALAPLPGSGDLCAFGAFTNIDGQPVPHAARWIGTAWTSLEAALGAPGNVAGAVLSDPEGDPASVYSGTRRFTSGAAAPSGLPGIPRNMVRWHQPASTLVISTVGAMYKNDGSGWTLLPDPSSGARVWTTTDTGVETLVRSRSTGLSRFVNNVWLQLGPSLTSATIESVATFNDDLGATLYIGGLLGSGTAATTPRFARLVSNQWQTIPINGRVRAMKIFDLGAGPELVVATYPAFTGEPCGIFAWNGTTLRDLNAGLPANPAVSALNVLDTTLGTNLWCNTAGALYFWNGANWQTSPAWSVSSNINSSATSLASTHNADATYSIFVGGSFSTAGGLTSVNIAELRFCPRACTPDFNDDGDTGTDADIEAFFACLAGTCCPTCGTSDFNNDGDFGTDADIESFFRVLAGGPC